MAYRNNALRFGRRRSDFEEERREHKTNCKWLGIVNVKLQRAAPYSFFLTRISDSLYTYPEDLSITFSELLDKSLGTVEHSIHINFMVELPWLLTQYAVNDLFRSPMTIICGVDDDDLHNNEDLNIKTILIPSIYRFGHHHTKMSLFFYTDRSVRIAVYTANLIESDWRNRTQGVWVSPNCPYMGEDIPINYGESETLFKLDLIKYLNSYKLVDLKEWIFRIQKCDLSSIKVCFVASIPGEYNDDNLGHKKLSKLIKANVQYSPSSDWDIVAQCSSIGSLGPTPHSWLFGEFGRSLNERVTHQDVPIKVIYPTVENVTRSLEGLRGGACLPYSHKVHDKQRWLREHLYKWRSQDRNRTRAVPHIKTYGKLSKDGTKLSWFLLTSANLSKAAWGRYKKDGKLLILSYEVGVLFLPKFFTGGNFFNVSHEGYVNFGDEDAFPLPYDSPIVPYDYTDNVYLIDRY